MFPKFPGYWPFKDHLQKDSCNYTIIFIIINKFLTGMLLFSIFVMGN